MGIFDGLFSTNSVLGIDIGTTSIKAVELKQGSSSPILVNYGLLETTRHFERENDIIQANSLSISKKQAVSLLNILIKKSSFKSKDVVTSVPSFASYTTLVEMPQMSDEETQKAMNFQVQQSIPLPVSQVAVDWLRVGNKEDETGNTKQFILIIAIPNDTIKTYQSIFKEVGLKLRSLEVEYLAYTRSVIGSDKVPTIILDIGARSTNITFVDQGFVKDNSQIDYAGDYLTQAIARGIGVSNIRAEELKRARGLSGGGGGFELSTLQTPFLDAIINEVAKEKAKFEVKFNVRVQRVLLIGGGAELLSIDKYVESKLEIPTAIGNGLLHVSYTPSLEMVSKELKTRFATAIGLAMRKFV